MLHAYGVFLGLAIVLGAWLGVRNAARDGFAVPRVLAALALGVPAGFLGARLQYAVVDPAAFDSVLDLVDFRGGRFYSFGAAAGGVLGTAVAARLLGLRPLALVERLVPGLALGLAVGRVGCFLAGCGYGAPTSLAWGVVFPAGSPAHEAHVTAGLVRPGAAASLAVHPTQLVELAVLLILALALQLRLRARPPAGAVLLAFAATYCLMRLGVEHLRGDPLGPADVAGLPGGEPVPIYPGVVQRGSVAYAEASGAPLAVAPDHWTDGCPVLIERRWSEGPPVVYRTYLDPGSGRSLFVEVALDGEPRSFEMSPQRWIAAAPS